MDEQIRRIEKMESLTAAMESANIALTEALQQWEAAHNGFKTVQAYYYGADWQADFDSSNQGKLPKNLSRGVLSEDWIYDVMGDNHQMAIRLLKVAMSELENDAPGTP